MEVNGSEIKQKTSKKYVCKICDYITDKKSNIDNHFNTPKHINNNDGNLNKQFLSKKYSCQICNYNTDRKSNIENHLNSLKHIQEINRNKNKQILSNNFECEIIELENFKPLEIDKSQLNEIKLI